MENSCRVCGAYAQYVNYGVLSCSSCKVFFRRNGISKQKIFYCKFNNQCEINLKTRHQCASCRLEKCVQLGMTADLFRSTRTKKNDTKKLTLISINSQKQRLSALNLLQSDQSLLTDEQWILLSNLFACYHESDLICSGQELLNLHQKYPSIENLYPRFVDQFLNSIYKVTGIYLYSNHHLRSLSSDERSILLNSAANNISCFSGVFSMQYCQLYNLKHYYHVIEKKYGRTTMDINIWAGKFFDSNILLTKLAVSLYAFSENFSNDVLHSAYMLKIQNKYAEVIWKYLIYKFGYFQAVQQFLRMVLCLCAVNVLTHHARNLFLHKNDIDSLIEQMEVAFILDDIDQIVSNQ